MADCLGNRVGGHNGASRRSIRRDPTQPVARFRGDDPSRKRNLSSGLRSRADPDPNLRGRAALAAVTGYGSWRNLVLPSFTLGAAVAAVLARFTRSAFIEVLQDDYLRTAYAKGLSAPVVVWKHAFRNALIPVITMTGLQFGFLLGGSIVVEKVFAWPGLGRLLIDAVDTRDYPVIQAEILLFALEFILINLFVDMLYAIVNPTIRYR